MARAAPSTPLIGSASSRVSPVRQVLMVMLVAVAGLCAAVLVLNASDLHRVKRYELIQMGVGAEDENDRLLIQALGKDDGDVSEEVEEMTDEEVESAQEETQEAVDAEIDEALKDAETAAQAGYDADLAKYKGQEAQMGHTGWAQSWAVPLRSAGLSASGVAGRYEAAVMQKLAMAQNNAAGARRQL